jgi:acetyl esterase
MDIREYRQMAEAQIAVAPNLSGGYPSGTYQEQYVPTSAGSTRLMIYVPRAGDAENLPVYINLHGGGFVLGFAEVDDPYCRRIAEEAGCIVVNVDYVLAPECPFPSAVMECYDVAQFIASTPGWMRIDPARIAIGGHSAGGNLAAAVCLLARERGRPKLVLQIIDCAVLDLATSPKAKQKDPSQPTDLADLGELYNAWYLPSAADAHNPLASPLLAPDLAGLPPALVITAEGDLLREEGEAYAGRLRTAHVDVLSKTYPSCGHGFTHSGPKEAAEDAWRLICSRLREAFRD